MKRVVGSTDFCKRCGAEYTVAWGVQKYCRKCALELNRNRCDTLGDSWAPATRNCIICGREFEVLGRRRLCCSPECSKKHLWEKAAECNTVRRRNAGISPRPNYTGYRWVVPAGKKYGAEFVVRGKRYFKGSFSTPEEAHEWAVAEREKIHTDSGL